MNELFCFVQPWAPSLAQELHSLQPVNVNKGSRSWVARDVAHCIVLEGNPPEAISDGEGLSRMESAYHNFLLCSLRVLLHGLI